LLVHGHGDEPEGSVVVVAAEGRLIGIFTERDVLSLGVGADDGLAGPRREVVMFANKTRVLLVLSQDVVDQARVFAGKATTTLKLPVSLQIVLRALIEEGLKRDDNPALLANVEGQAKAVRHIRRVARQGGRAEEDRGDRRSGIPRRPSGREQQRRRA
jgi:CBS domain-containing protein